MMKNAKTLLVTGATGVLGSTLVEHLLREGHSVIAIGRKKYGLLSTLNARGRPKNEK